MLRRRGAIDITVDGRKFSGNAFYRTGDGCYHHGTILIRADKENMSRYLNVSKEKLCLQRRDLCKVQGGQFMRV